VSLFLVIVGVIFPISDFIGVGFSGGNSEGVWADRLYVKSRAHATVEPFKLSIGHPRCCEYFSHHLFTGIF
jgi:hypothetical protein